MQVTVQRFRNNTFLARGESNHWTVIDTKREFGGAEGACSPMELLLSALGGCTAMDVESLLNKMHTPVSDFRVEIQAERREEHPRIFTRIRLKFIFFGADLNQANIAKAVELSQNKYCSVSAMLAKAVPITYELVFNPTVD